MRIVADTHVIIWDALAPDKLSNKARKVFDEANDSEGILFCDISLWEISMLIDKERLIIDVPFLEFIELLSLSRNYIFQPITPEIADKSIKFGLGPISDPADRLISATSIFSGSPLVTADKNIRESENVHTIW